MRDQAVHLPRGTTMRVGSLPEVSREVYFQLWLAAIAILAGTSHATGHFAAHGVFLLVAAMLFHFPVSTLVPRKGKVSR